MQEGLARAETPGSRKAPSEPEAALIETDIPARLERLPWGRFHTLIVIALGVTWILDGLEVTLAGAVAGALKESPRLQFSNTQVGLASSFYLAGAVFGSLYFGWLTDRLGRKRLFSITLSLYLVATAATGLSWNVYSFSLFRFLTGAGIGGEYTAIASTIQEFIPARYRGWTDLVINGSFWIGAAIGAAASLVLLDPALMPPDFGWRSAFLIGALLGLVILFLRAWIPESPRWLMTHGRADEGQAILTAIEGAHTRRKGTLPPVTVPAFKLRPRRFTPLAEVWDAIVHTHRRRTLVGLSLMVSQAFFYNAIFFTYALVLTDFYGISASRVGLYILPFALGNFLGPLTLGRLFDTLGRRKMIAATYILSGLLLGVSGYLFQQGVLTAWTQTIAWMIVFFFASAAASSAYLTVSETFPLEVRALAIAFFYAVGTGIGGVVAPAIFGVLIETGSRVSVAAGYVLGAALMLAASIIAARFCVPAERKPLEVVAPPLSAVG
jgi:MFS family permease